MPDQINPEQRFVYAATIRVESNRLQLDGAGRIIEDPELLARFARLIEGLKKVAANEFRFGEVAVEAGAYACDVTAAEGLIAPWSKVDALLSRFHRDNLRLEQNGGLEEPASAADCGVSPVALGVLETASVLSAGESPVRFFAPCGEVHELAAPTATALAAIVHDPVRNPRRIAGEVQGIARGDERGSAVRVGKTEFLVERLSLADAWKALSERKVIHGVARWDDGAYLVSGHEFRLADRGQLGLEWDRGPG